MTVGDIIRNTEKLRPGSEMSRSDMLSEINRTELDIYDNIILRHEGSGELRVYGDESDELSVPDNFAELYKFRLVAKIDLNNGDVTRYTNNMLLYNNLMSGYYDWYNRRYMPLSRTRLRWC